MVATKHYDMWVKEAVCAGADAIVSGAGLPVSLPEYAEAAYAEMKAAYEEMKARLDQVKTGAAELKASCEELCRKLSRRTKLAPIVSTAKAAMVICRMWDRKYNRVPDFIVVEGPLAGGHLGFSKEQLAQFGADTDDVEKNLQSGSL